MSSIAGRIGRARRSAVGRQTMWFVLLSGMGSLLAAISTGVLAHALTTEGFGAFTFSKSLLALIASIFEFGIFFPAARLAALADDDRDRREWVGTTLLAYLPLAIGYVVVVALVSFAADPVFNVRASDALLLTAPLALGYPFGMVALSLSQGTGRAFLQPLMAFAAGILLLVGVVIGQQTSGSALSLTFVLAIRGFAFVAAALLVVALVRPLLGGVRRRAASIWSETRRWGMRAYVGRVISMGTYNVDVLIVAALTNPKDLGAYGLAVSASNLIIVPAVGLGTALFPRMTQRGTLDRRPIAAIVAWGLCATVGGAFASVPVIDRINPDLSDASILLVPLGLAATVRAVTSILNSFLSARAAGRALQNTSIILATANLALTPVLVVLAGARGAAMATLLAMLVNLAGYLYYVRRLPDPVRHERNGA